MRQLTCPKVVTHPSTNRARCRATVLIETNALLLHQTANLCGHVSWQCFMPDCMSRWHVSMDEPLRGARCLHGGLSFMLILASSLVAASCRWRWVGATLLRTGSHGSDEVIACSVPEIIRSDCARVQVSTSHQHVEMIKSKSSIIRRSEIWFAIWVFCMQITSPMFLWVKLLMTLLLAANSAWWCAIQRKKFQ